MSNATSRDDSSEDDLDIFASSLSTVFSIETPAITSQHVTLYGITVSPPSPLAANWGLHADAVWKGSTWLAGIGHAPDVEGKRVLELGAAAGLLGLVLAKYRGAEEVLLSDYPDPQVLETLRNNVARNRMEGKMVVKGHRWGEGNDWEGDAGFDVVVGGDIVWLGDQHANLCDTLRRTLKRSPKSIVRLAEGSQSGKWTILSFLAKAHSMGFAVAPLTQASLTGEARRPWDADRVEEDIERRNWLTIMDLCWSREALQSGEAE